MEDPLGADDARNRIELRTFADLDALVDLVRHLSRVNPQASVEWRRLDKLREEDLQGHVVLLGNLAWLPSLGRAFLPADLPIRPVQDDRVEDGEVFEIIATGERLLPDVDDGQVTTDVALFARARNAFDREVTVSICSGVFTRGGYAAVRALTDDAVRHENAAFLLDHAGDADTFGVLTRVATLGPLVRTPRLRDDRTRLLLFP
jgi:hypothetical protein